MTKFNVGDRVITVTQDPYSGMRGTVHTLPVDGYERYQVGLDALGEKAVPAHIASFDESELMHEVPANAPDAVSPSHYRVGNTEVIELTRHMGFLDGNIVKYVSRYKQKNGLEDLYKARKYLDWLIEDEEQSNG